MDDATQTPGQPETSDVEAAAASTLPQLLLETRIMALVPADAGEKLVAPIEVMVQEGVKVFSLPAGLIEQVAKLSAVFGPRACFAIHDVDERTVQPACDSPAQLVSLRVPDEALVAQLRAAGKKVLVPALTPTEVQQAARLDVDGVVVVPAEVMGSSYPEGLMPLVGEVTVGARGGLGSYSARRWIEAGARFVCLDAALVGDAMTGGVLSGLRERCQNFVTSVAG